MRRVTKFDDRRVDFLTGKKVSPPMEDRRQCACCNLRIVKGWILDNGDQVGEDCEDVISRADMQRRSGFSVTVYEFDDARHKSIGWRLKATVKNYIGRTVFA